MSVAFTAGNHKYVSIDGDDILWTSTTSFISKFKQPFDRDGVAEKVSKSKKSKWYGKTPDEIKAIWDAEASRAMDLGNWYHELFVLFSQGNVLCIGSLFKKLASLI